MQCPRRCAPGIFGGDDAVDQFGGGDAQHRGCRRPEAHAEPSPARQDELAMACHGSNAVKLSSCKEHMRVQKHSMFPARAAVGACSM